MQRPAIFLTLSMTLLLGACSDDKNTTDAAESTGTAATDSMGSATSTGDDATAGSATDTGNSSTTVVSTTDLMPTTDGSKTGSESAGSETDGLTTGGTDFAMLCADLCQQNATCAGTPMNICMMKCFDEFKDLESPCKEASEDFLVCLTTMTCDQLAAFQFNDDPGPCGPQIAKLEDACPEEPTCSGSVGANEDNTVCFYDTDCPDTPGQGMICDTKICTCTTDGQEIGTCPAENVCMDLDTVEDKFNDCCVL